MQDTVAKEVRKRAYFVAGSRAWSRPENDPIVESAIEDAGLYLDSLADSNIRPPTISGATTGTVESIVVLYWLVESSDGLRTIEVRFHGNHECSVRLSTKDGRESTQSHLKLADVLALDLPTHVQQFQKRAPPINGALAPR